MTNLGPIQGSISGDFLSCQSNFQIHVMDVLYCAAYGTERLQSNSYMFVNQIYLLSGKGTVLVAGLQARNNARVVFAGSIDMLSDKFFNAKVSSSSGKKAAKSGNQALAVALASWCFQLSGVLRVKVCKLDFVFVYLG